MADLLLKIKTVIAEILVENLKASLIENDYIARNGINYGPLTTDSNIYRLIDYEVIGDNVFISMPSYAVNIEFGRRAGTRMPPMRSILLWIRRKGITPRDGISLNQLAFLIARSIARRGIPARPFIERAIERTQDDERLDLNINEFIDEQIQNLIDNII
jgi:hypothetical protein